MLRCSKNPENYFSINKRKKIASLKSAMDMDLEPDLFSKLAYDCQKIILIRNPYDATFWKGLGNVQFSRK
jgi:hypothetical protein